MVIIFFGKVLIFMKFFFSQTSPINQTISDEELKRNALLEDLQKTKQALELAYMGLDNVTEPDLIDCYIYEVNSVMKRYDFILEQVAKLHPAEQTDRLPGHPQPLVASDTETSVPAVI